MTVVAKHRGETVPIPDFQAVMLPLVEALADGQERTMRQLTEQLAERFKLTEQEREELLPSGQQTIFSNRVAWSKSHLKYAGLIENPTRGRVRISDLGRKVLADRPQAINVKFLKHFPSYRCESGQQGSQESNETRPSELSAAMQPHLGLTRRGLPGTIPAPSPRGVVDRRPPG
jgi:restriction system protein